MKASRGEEELFPLNWRPKVSRIWKTVRSNPGDGSKRGWTRSQAACSLPFPFLRPTPTLTVDAIQHSHKGIYRASRILPRSERVLLAFLLKSRRATFPKEEGGSVSLVERAFGGNSFLDFALPCAVERCIVFSSSRFRLCRT